MSELVKSVSIENMINQRAAVVERVMAALDLLSEAQGIARAAHVGFPDFGIDQGYRRSSTGLGDRAALDKAVLREIDSAAWKYLMDESGLRSFMDSKARAEWDSGLREGVVPELTVDTVASTFAGLYGARGDMFERGVIECFKSLSWTYKTNLPQKFGKRLIMQNLHSGGYCSVYGKMDKLDDLMRVMCVADGKPEPDYRSGTSNLISAGLRESKGWPKFVENEMMSLKLFKNGNGHITFKRPELVNKLNLIIAKHYPGALPAPK